MKQNYEIPIWLNKAFLAKVLRHNQPGSDTIEISKFEVESATNKGDNFVSELFRVTYSYSRNGEIFSNQKFLVKVKPIKEEVSQVFAAYDMYRNEIVVYQTFLPEFEKILKEVGISVQLGPKLLFADFEKDAFVMQDASVEDYKNANKDQRIPIETAKNVLKKLAYFHAASAVYNQRNDQSLAKMTSTLFIEDLDSIMPMIDCSLKAFVAQASTWEGFEDYIPKLEDLRRNFKQIANKTMTPVEGLNCLNHGDLWFNNILIQKQSKDVLFIDYQMPCWASPVLDLLYFFYTSLKEEDYQTRIDELIQFYHSILDNTLRKLNFKTIPSLHQLHLDFTQKYFHSE